ncbi:MAG TPA: hypothetical protein V6D50_08950, partial [Chroococcales cyanobacterium]
KWIAFEQNHEYLAASAFRFFDSSYNNGDIVTMFKKLIDGKETLNLLAPQNLRYSSDTVPKDQSSWRDLESV